MDAAKPSKIVLPAKVEAPTCTAPWSTNTPPPDFSFWVAQSLAYVTFELERLQVLQGRLFCSSLSHDRVEEGLVGLLGRLFQVVQGAACHQDSHLLLGGGGSIQFALDLAAVQH